LTTDERSRTVGGMSQPPLCPRCAGPLRAPDLWSSAWRCSLHGGVTPWHPATTSSAEALARLAADAAVPVWVIEPPLPGWTLGGSSWCGEARRGHTATAVATCGPAPLGGLAEMVLVAEEPGIGLGARLAGLDATDPGTPKGEAAEKVIAAGHPTPLWRCESPPDRAAFIGEASGVWLWCVMWPAEAAYVLVEHVELADLRDGVPAAALVAGALCPRLLPPSPV